MVMGWSFPAPTMTIFLRSAISTRKKERAQVLNYLRLFCIFDYTFCGNKNYASNITRIVIN